MQEQIKYIYNGKEVSKEVFQDLAGDNFKWFKGSSVMSVGLDSFNNFFDGNFKSEKQINNHVKSVIEEYKKPQKNILNGYDKIREIDKSLQKLRGLSTTCNKKEGVKLNKNKPQLSLLFKQFPKALEAIVKCSEYGHKKYKETDQDYLNYQRVEGGSQTYADASLRHRLEKGNDLESGLPHQFHVAWNALAELELWIKENVK